MTASAYPKIEALQGLRGITALTVVIGHSLLIFQAPAWFRKAEVLFNGQAAVVIFFVLSGFVLTRSLRRYQTEATLDFSAFVIKRFFRLYPALWVATIFGLAYYIVIHNRFTIPNPSEFFLLRYPEHRFTPLHVAASFAGALAFLVPPVWSVFVEIVGSIFMPFIAWAAFRKHEWFGVGLSAMLIVSLTIGGLSYYQFGMYLGYFMLGAALCVLPPALKASIAKLRPWRTPLILLIAAAVLPSQWLPWRPEFVTFYEACCAAAMIALIVYADAGKEFLTSKPIVYLGDISYSVYLLHFTVLSLFAKLGAAAFAHYGLQPPGVVENIILAVATVAATIPLSGLMYRRVELPAIELGRRTISQLGLARTRGAEVKI
jgi:peptidoglycan/LPS O-acetylase OafA/YrhL